MINIKWKLTFMSTAFLLLLTSMSHASAPVRVSAVFDYWNDTKNNDPFGPYVEFILPGNIKKGIEIKAKERLSVADAFTGFVDGSTISYNIDNRWGKSQSETCEGTIKLQNAEGAPLEAVQLSFTIIENANPRKDPPWFKCELKSKYKKI